MGKSGFPISSSIKPNCVSFCFRCACLMNRTIENLIVSQVFQMDSPSCYLVFATSRCFRASDKQFADFMRCDFRLVYFQLNIARVKHVEKLGCFLCMSQWVAWTSSSFWSQTSSSMRTFCRHFVANSDILNLNGSKWMSDAQKTLSQSLPPVENMQQKQGLPLTFIGI